MTYHYVWLLWSSAFLLAWILLYLAFPRSRLEMWWTSAFMAPLGLTEPIFVPEYWNPPSLFELAQRTGFDIESIISASPSAASVLCSTTSIMHKRLVEIGLQQRHDHGHRGHRWALAVPFASFPALYFLRWNPVDASIAAMVLGAIAAVLCRPDLKSNTLLGGALFLARYAIFMLSLKWLAPGYIEQVWNFKALSGIVIYGLPIEELLFGFSFGMMWAGIYEHFTWRQGISDPASQ